MTCRKTNSKSFGFRIIVFAVMVAVLGVIALVFCKCVLYPKKYCEYVEQYSDEYGIDEDFAYAVICVESKFDTEASSEAGATGLMQIMEDAFKWTQKSLSVEDREITYSAMSQPKYNIEYGCCMLGYYYEKYGSYELSAAAYHAGTNKVNKWLRDGVISVSDFNADDIPSSVTAHYVKKVMRAYNAYDILY